MSQLMAFVASRFRRHHDLGILCPNVPPVYRSGLWKTVTPQPAQGSTSLVVPGGQPALTCLGIWSLGSGHASALGSTISGGPGGRHVSCLALQGLGVCYLASLEGHQRLGIPCLFPSLLFLGFGLPLLFSVIKGIGGCLYHLI